MFSSKNQDIKKNQERIHERYVTSHIFSCMQRLYTFMQRLIIKKTSLLHSDS